MTFESLRIPSPVKAEPTNEMYTAADDTVYRIYSDGSRRRDPVRLRGKAAVKRAKRARPAGQKSGLLAAVFA